MFDIYTREITVAGRILTLETGRIARQADGAVLASYGETSVLCTVVAAKYARPGQDFFPLTVHYQEKTFAAGKVPGGFFKREGRPSEKETLTSRLIDRPLRPLFPENFRNETQVICTVLSHDLENDPDMVAMIGASAALTISGIPFFGPIGGVRVGRINDRLILNPPMSQMADSSLDLLVAGTSEGVLMIESEAQELSEAEMLEAVTLGHGEIRTIVDGIIGFAEKCAKEPWNLPEPSSEGAEIKAHITKLAEESLRSAYTETDKQARVQAVNAIRTKVKDQLIAEEQNPELGLIAFKSLEKDIVRGTILETGCRIDGRDTKTVRPISAQVGLLPRTHGSALFTRGETQSLCVTTLGTGQDEQIIDALEGEYRQNFMLHYNFPPYSVGEAGRLGTPGRREIGHGKLAWRALRAVLPTKESFPYTIRIVSEITESNGSSSMATVCGGSLSMMDAGVPIKASVAGIAMGLIKEGDQFAVLSDILGDEDYLGDMDFKVAGTEAGVTSLQMDIKITSITTEIMKKALEQAREGRLHILAEMQKSLGSSREVLSSNAPRITSISIPKEKIREVIGSGGKVIREICETTGAKVDIEDDGTVKVAATDEATAEQAVNWIKSIIAEPEMGMIYPGTVVKTMDFGAFVNFMGSRDGLVHISELKPERVGKTTDVVNQGDKVKVKVIGFDERGKIKLSMRQVNQETGIEYTREEQDEMRTRKSG